MDENGNKIYNTPKFELSFIWIFHQLVLGLVKTFLILDVQLDTGTDPL